MITGEQYAEQAKSAKYTGIKYSVLDCQGFVEKVLNDAGGTSYNWRGSNHMWRDALSWKGTYDEAIQKFGSIPVGAWLFTWANDGGEKERGYTDGLGNAKHVGIYVGGAAASASRHSTRNSTQDGVGYSPCPASRWTHVGLCKYIDYGSTEDASDLKAQLEAIAEALDALQEKLKILLNGSDA